MLRFDESNFYVYNAADGSMTVSSYQGRVGDSYTVNGGNWIYTAVTYNHADKKINVYMETINTVAELDVEYPMTTEQFS